MILSVIAAESGPDGTSELVAIESADVRSARRDDGTGLLPVARGVSRSQGPAGSGRLSLPRAVLSRHRIAIASMLAVFALVAALLTAHLSGGQSDTGATSRLPEGPVKADARAGITKIKHIVVVMQENRSFDSYFGTFPGADGFPTSGGKINVCVPDPETHGCIRPFHDRQDVNGGGPHGHPSAVADIAGGRMDGFVGQAEAASRLGACTDPNAPECLTLSTHDVMGYHDGRELPNYWAYAKNFVLQDHMFEPNTSWSLPAHLFTVSEWSALCANHDPEDCVTNQGHPGGPP